MSAIVLQRSIRWSVQIQGKIFFSRGAWIVVTGIIFFLGANTKTADKYYSSGPNLIALNTLFYPLIYSLNSLFYIIIY